MPLLYLLIALVVVIGIAKLVNSGNLMPENMKPIANVVLGLIIVGMVLWLINTYVPMAESIKTILNIVVVVATCVFVLQATGLWAGTVRMANNAWFRITRPSPPPEAPKPSEPQPSEH